MVKRRRKTRTHLKGPNNSAATSTSAPKSFIIRTGKVPRSVSTLVQDTRKVMEPNTATRLRERNNNKLKDFISMAGPIGVTHLLIFGQTDAGTNLRILRAPRGPTLTFRVNKYALSKDVQAASRRPTPPGSEFVTPPLLVLNNFGGEERQIKLLVATFQNLFPPIQVQTMKLSQARRIVLLNYNSATRTIDWRHFLISVRPVGVSKSVRRVIEGSRSTLSSSTTRPGRSRGRLPDLSSTQDISDYILNHTTTSGGTEFETDASEAESEAEDAADSKNKVHLHDRYVGRGNSANTQKAVRLREIGPRMELKLVKIEEGCNQGAVLFHEYVEKRIDSDQDSEDQYLDDDQVDDHSKGGGGGGQPWNPKRGDFGFDNPPGVDPHSDESDLEPIPLGNLQHDYDSADAWPEYSDDDDDQEMPKSKAKKSGFKPSKKSTSASAKANKARR
uniref:Related to SSF1-Nucleolar protein involved in the assembly of the large ribosomal subunit n=1 Tax=Melanopsichium pennsylvanicum 4 TaxID=1398559 RepID=A0A077RBB4_9BASI|nr:related to SSF1-Nucleolar protein involved in the assembly of the large ribosomal subunit [Melanopsichium pennsylvanicum 4]